jgi:hypothetical protein
MDYITGDRRYLIGHRAVSLHDNLKGRLVSHWILKRSDTQLIGITLVETRYRSL